MKPKKPPGNLLQLQVAGGKIELPDYSEYRATAKSMRKVMELAENGDLFAMVFMFKLATKLAHSCVDVALTQKHFEAAKLLIEDSLVVPALFSNQASVLNYSKDAYRRYQIGEGVSMWGSGRWDYGNKASRFIAATLVRMDGCRRKALSKPREHWSGLEEICVNLPDLSPFQKDSKRKKAKRSKTAAKSLDAGCKKWRDAFVRFRDVLPNHDALESALLDCRELAGYHLRRPGHPRLGIKEAVLRFIRDYF